VADSGHEVPHSHPGLLSMAQISLFTQKLLLDIILKITPFHAMIKEQKWRRMNES